MNSDLEKTWVLMNGDTQVLQFNIEDADFMVLNNDFMPYALKDYLNQKSGDNYIKDRLNKLSAIKDYLANRVLSLSRTNAKAILNSANLSQGIHINERVKIALACQGLSMTDNIWIKEESDPRSFAEVNLRNHHLGDVAYEIAILGIISPVSKDILKPDIMTAGMYAKTWSRESDGSYLLKTDNTHGDNACSEYEANQFLNATNIPHVEYSLHIKDGMFITKCRNIASDNVSLIDGFELKDYCDHIGTDFRDFFYNINPEMFRKICTVDYLMANTDRHLGNIGFLVDNKTNKIIDYAPLFDHNQAFIADKLNSDISDLKYDLTGLTMKESAMKYAIDIDFDHNRYEMSEKVLERFNDVQSYLGQEISDTEIDDHDDDIVI